MLLIMQLMAGILSGPLGRYCRFRLHIMYPVVDSVAEHSDDMSSVWHSIGRMVRQWKIVTALQSMFLFFLRQDWVLHTHNIYD